jgi:hypothetical protein
LPLLSSLVVPNQMALAPGTFSTARNRPYVLTKYAEVAPALVPLSSTRHSRWPRNAAM